MCVIGRRGALAWGGVHCSSCGSCVGGCAMPPVEPRCSFFLAGWNAEHARFSASGEPERRAEQKRHARSAPRCSRNSGVLEFFEWFVSCFRHFVRQSTTGYTCLAVDSTFSERMRGVNVCRVFPARCDPTRHFFVAEKHAKVNGGILVAQ